MNTDTELVLYYRNKLVSKCAVDILICFYSAYIFGLEITILGFLSFFSLYGFYNYSISSIYFYTLYFISSLAIKLNDTLILIPMGVSMYLIFLFLLFILELLFYKEALLFSKHLDRLNPMEIRELL